MDISVEQLRDDRTFFFSRSKTEKKDHRKERTQKRLKTSRSQKSIVIHNKTASRSSRADKKALLRTSSIHGTTSLMLKDSTPIETAVGACIEFNHFTRYVVVFLMIDVHTTEAAFQTTERRPSQRIIVILCKL
ncbi:hypothetical protein KIN20_016470 [Parelaphostrongylus tenuis]|uniref:Uncharacterized protein n=1 Tax=Parelaphostrongylus tenuis TaxID=148309 RepID=A0AAD5MK32_PARTN|nr:hypothetical protein KIN20_016470 [Parelaphostrongylus tenuis]